MDQGPRMERPVGKVVPRRQISLSQPTASTGHVATWRKNKAAVIWEGEPGEIRTLTYQQLLSAVSRCANVLKSFGVKKGRSRRHLRWGCRRNSPSPCWRARASARRSTVIFGGFSSRALVDRINDAECSCVITQDGTFRGAERSNSNPPSMKALTLVAHR